MNMLNVFIGYDDREDDAYKVCASSLRRHTSVPLAIHKLDQKKMRAIGAYTRPEDEPASTQFAFTRFLVPFLCGYRGTAMFCDCDFLFTRDIADIMHYIPVAGPVSCVQHDYIPVAKWKMDGQPQVAYPRKNWSSLMLFNNALANQLTLDYVNKAPASDLHQFKWTDEPIGNIPHEFNWLEGEYNWPFGSLSGHPPLEKHDGSIVNAHGVLTPPPAGIHFTNGGPWHSGYHNVRFANLWRAELANLQ